MLNNAGQLFWVELRKFFPYILNHLFLLHVSLNLRTYVTVKSTDVDNVRVGSLIGVKLGSFDNLIKNEVKFVSFYTPKRYILLIILNEE